jgi:hypothetical protein
MVGYAVIWIFFVIFGLLFLATAAGHYSARFVVWLRNYWMGR